MEDSVRIERRGRIAIVRFDRGVKANPLSHDLMRALTDAARGFEDDTETSAVILTGRADSFTLGMDLKDPTVAKSRDAGLAERRNLLQAGPRMCRAWEEIEPLTIVAIEGWCVGGGVALAASCDLRVMGESAQLYVPEIERGMNMGWGTVPRLVNLCGPARTKRLVILAEKINAKTAEEWGMADGTAPDGGALEAALVLAERVAAMPPVAVRLCKQAINAATTALNHAVSHADMDQFAIAQASDDFDEGVRAFLEKRPPRYTGN
ncbi:MAG: enoyl-CoA hydratase/isomerase family protein [Rhodospirillales bacterium]|nr:enoyl-CoA hydratase/isomerase family protein [Rhodospirillales bacterium]MCW9039852.1 enoyl-CoA hydratase/isomerase family protein [Rhodospirillales bacterium]